MSSPYSCFTTKNGSNINWCLKEKKKIVMFPFSNLSSLLTFISPANIILLPCFHKSTRSPSPEMLQGRIIVDPTCDWNTPGDVKILGPVVPSGTKIYVRMYDIV